MEESRVALKTSERSFLILPDKVILRISKSGASGVGITEFRVTEKYMLEVVDATEDRVMSRVDIGEGTVTEKAARLRAIVEEIVKGKEIIDVGKKFRAEFPYSAAAK